MIDSDSDHVPSDEDAFPELLAFQAEEKKRHKRLIRQVMFASLLLFFGGIGVLFLADEDAGLKYIPAGILMVCLGLIGVIRALVSSFTDIDTRDHELWDGVIGTEEEMMAENARDDSGEA